MPATDLEKLIVQLEANSTKLDKTLDRVVSGVDRRLGAVEKRTEAMSSRVSAGFAKAGERIAEFFTIREIIRFVGNVTEAAEKLENLTKRTGASAEELQKLQYAGRQVDVSTESMNEALDRFGRFLGKAEAGTGDLAKVMKEFHIQAGQDIIGTLLEVAEAVKNAQSRTEEYRITTAAFGRGSAELVSFLRQGKDAIKAQMDEFNRGLSDKTIKDLADFAKSWREIEVSFTNMAAGPTSLVLRGLSKFLADLSEGTWLQKLQALASLLSGGLIVAPPQIEGLETFRDRYRRLFSELTDLQKQLASEQGPAMFPADKILRDNLAKQIEDKQHQLQQLQILASKEPVPGKEKPFGGEDEGDLEAARKEIARTAALRAAAERDLVKATGEANAEKVRDTQAFYDFQRRQIMDTATAAIQAEEAKAAAEMESAEKSKIGAKAVAEAKVNITAASIAAQGAIAENARRDLERVDYEQLTQARATAEQLKALEEARAQTLQRTATEAAAANRELVRAADDASLVISRGTAEYFERVRLSIEDELRASKDVILEQEQLEIDSLQRIREQRISNKEDGISVWKDYDEAVLNVHHKTLDQIAAAEEKARLDRHQAKEEETHDLQRQIDIMDAVRSGIEDVGISALDGSKNFGEAVRDMIRQLILLEIRLRVFRPLIEDTFGKIGTTGPSGSGGILGVARKIGGFLGLGGLGGLGAGTGSLATDDFGNLVEAADGAVVGPGGKVKLEKFARGGVGKARNPKLAIYDEGSMNEAHVPLPDGRRIPVKLDVPMVSEGSASQGPMQLVIKNEFSLVDANGDAAIRRLVEQGSAAAYAQALKTIKRSLPDMIVSVKRDKL